MHGTKHVKFTVFSSLFIFYILINMRTLFSNVWGRLVVIFILGLFFLFTLKYEVEITKYLENSKNVHSEDLWSQTLDFAHLGFTNETGNPSGCYVVPNYIHFVHFGGTPLRYVEMICVLAAFKNQRPDKIFFHYDNDETFSGKYWNILMKTPGFLDIIEFNEVSLPDEIFGQPLSEEWRRWHGSDIMRLRMLMKYGGIFLDNDCYLVKSLDNYRRFEISINWDENQFLGSQVIVAHKDARFLMRWLNCYRVYDKTKWYYNAGERPTVEVLYKEPELVHRVKNLFGADNNYVYKLFQQQWPGWRSLYVVHLLDSMVRNQNVLKPLNTKAVFPVTLNEVNIAYYPVTFREMAYEVYDIANIKWPKARLEDEVYNEDGHRRKKY